MLVQAAAAKRTVPADPERARAAIAAVEETGREALGRAAAPARRPSPRRRGARPRRRSPRWCASAPWSRACARPGCRVELEVGGDSGPPAARRRRRRLPHRPGGARQRHAPRRRHARARARRLRARGRRARRQRRRVGAGRPHRTTAAGSSTCASASALYGGELRADRRRPAASSCARGCPSGSRQREDPTAAALDLRAGGRARRARRARAGAVVRARHAARARAALGAVLRRRRWRGAAPRRSRRWARSSAAPSRSRWRAAPEDLASTSILVAILSFALGAHLPRRRALAGLGACSRWSSS